MRFLSNAGPDCLPGRAHDDADGIPAALHRHAGLQLVGIYAAARPLLGLCSLDAVVVFRLDSDASGMVR